MVAVINRSRNGVGNFHIQCVHTGVAGSIFHDNNEVVDN